MPLSERGRLPELGSNRCRHARFKMGPFVLPIAQAALSVLSDSHEMSPWKASGEKADNVEQDYRRGCWPSLYEVRPGLLKFFFTLTIHEAQSRKPTYV